MSSRLVPVALLLSSWAYAARAETITLSVAPTTGLAGQTADVGVNVSGAKELVAWQFVVLHDPDVLKVTGVEAGSVAEGGLVESSFETAGRTWVAGVRVQPVTRSGDLLRISYQVIGQPGASSSLSIEDAKAWQANETEILVETTPGTFRVGAAAPEAQDASPAQPAPQPTAAPEQAMSLVAMLLLVLIGMVLAVAIAASVYVLRRPVQSPSIAPPAVRHELHEHGPHRPSDGKIHLKCPQCGRALAAPLEAAGHGAKCNKCGAHMMIPPMAEMV